MNLKYKRPLLLIERILIVLIFALLLIVLFTPLPEIYIVILCVLGLLISFHTFTTDLNKGISGGGR